MTGMSGSVSGWERNGNGVLRRLWRIWDETRIVGEGVGGKGVEGGEHRFLHGGGCVKV